MRRTDTCRIARSHDKVWIGDYIAITRWSVIINSINITIFDSLNWIVVVVIIISGSSNRSRCSGCISGRRCRRDKRYKVTFTHTTLMEITPTHRWNTSDTCSSCVIISRCSSTITILHATTSRSSGTRATCTFGCDNVKRHIWVLKRLRGCRRGLLWWLSSCRISVRVTKPFIANLLRSVHLCN